MLTIASIEADYKTTLAELISEYGEASSVPPEQQYIASERLRAGYCVISNSSTNLMEVFKQYSIDRRVWNFFVDDVPEDGQVFGRRQKRTDKYQSIVDWTKEHLFEQITPNSIMEVGEISYPTALKFINDRPDLFRKIKRGVYEVRDPQADRAKAS
jgi:hypothetical protein